MAQPDLRIDGLPSALWTRVHRYCRLFLLRRAYVGLYEPLSGSHRGTMLNSTWMQNKRESSNRLNPLFIRAEARWQGGRLSSPNTKTQSLIYPGRGEEEEEEEENITKSRNLGRERDAGKAVGRRTAAAESRPLPWKIFWGPMYGMGTMTKFFHIKKKGG